MLVYQRVSWGPYFPKPCHPRHTDLVQLQGLAFQISQAFLEVLAAHLVKPYRSQTTNYELEASQRWSTIYVYLCLFIYYIYNIYIYILYAQLRKYMALEDVSSYLLPQLEVVPSPIIVCRCLKMASPHGFMKFHEHRHLSGANVWHEPPKLGGAIFSDVPSVRRSGAAATATLTSA